MTDTSELVEQLLSERIARTEDIYRPVNPLLKKAATALTAKDSEIEVLRDKLSKLEEEKVDGWIETIDNQHDRNANMWQARAETAERRVAELEASALAIENEKLKSWINIHRGDTMSLSNDVDHFREELADAERERDEARAALEELSVGHECQLHLANAALKPFSSLFDLIDDLADSPDDTVFFQHDGTIITFGQIRAARAVIEQGE